MPKRSSPSPDVVHSVEVRKFDLVVDDRRHCLDKQEGRDEHDDRDHERRSAAGDVAKIRSPTAGPAGAEGGPGPGSARIPAAGGGSSADRPAGRTTAGRPRAGRRVRRFRHVRGAVMLVGRAPPVGACGG